MKRTFVSLAVHSGFASLAALAIGCSHPPQAAPSRAPSFESNVGNEPTASIESSPPRETLRTERAEPATAGRGTSDLDAAALATERGMCEALTRVARLRVEDIAGGSAIVLVPQLGDDLGGVRESARRIARAMESHDARRRGGGCALFDVGRAGAGTAITQGPTSVRLLLTSSDPREVDSIRKLTRIFVDRATSATDEPPRPTPPTGPVTSGE